MSTRLIAAVVTASLALPAVALADEQHFVAITKAQLGGVGPADARWKMRLVGKLDGEGNVPPRTRTYRADYGVEDKPIMQHCHKLALLVMSKPGRFQLDVSVAAYGTDEFYVFGCGVTALAAP
jgi:hypothetical protein